jgi:ketosteroid isomerase-like protein
MSISLPLPISTYFAASNTGDAKSLAGCFTDNATVKDEGQVHRGRDEIEAWQREAKQKFTFTVEPLGCDEVNDQVTVSANVAGNFPGSPARLDHVFRLAGDKIQSLEIH